MTVSNTPASNRSNNSTFLPARWFERMLLSLIVLTTTTTLIGMYMSSSAGGSSSNHSTHHEAVVLSDFLRPVWKSKTRQNEQLSLRRKEQEQQEPVLIVRQPEEQEEEPQPEVEERQPQQTETDTDQQQHQQIQVQAQDVQVVVRQKSPPVTTTTTVTTTDNTSPGKVPSRNMTFTNDLGPLLDETVKLLFRNHPAAAQEYIQKYPGSSFKIYVYDDLPTNFTWEYCVDCVNKYNYNNFAGCDWGESICGMKTSDGGTFAKRRLNRNGDVVLSKLFAQYRGPSRTYDPNEATLIIVPFPSQAHLHCMGAQRQWYYDIVKEGLTDKLKYLTPETKHKHVFLSSAVQPASNKWLRGEFPLVISLGYVERACPQARGKERPNCGQIVMPYVNTNEDYQPTVVGQRNFKPIRERGYALVAKLNTNIAGRRTDRQFFMESAKQYMEAHNNTLVNRLVSVGELGGRRTMGNEMDILQTYRDTIFCPCLRGDEPPQKRFFDVILSGCLPVVLEHTATHEGTYSWFASGAAAIHDVYPFANGTFYHQPDMGIDYKEFVVAVNGTCGAKCIIPHLEHLLLHEVDKLQAMQDRMKEYVRLLTFGMAENTLQGIDAVSAILVSARHYVENWTPGEEHTLEGKVKQRNMQYTASLATLLDNTVRLLLPPEEADKYISIYPGSKFKVYVYDNLPDEYQWQSIEDCLVSKYNLDCDWAESLCELNTTETGLWLDRRSNGNVDMIVARAFAQYIGPARTFDPSEADVFVVPWPSQAYFFCRRNSFRGVNAELMEGLEYFNGTTRDRHVFLASGGWVPTKKELPIMVSNGPVHADCETASSRSNCAKFALGRANTNPRYQPAVVSQNFERPVRDRQYSLAFIATSEVTGSAATIRQSFYDRIAEQSLKDNNNNAGSIGGLPLVVVDLNRARSESDILQLYRDSIFCPILPGNDAVPQKLFFDSIMSGCLPVVLEYEYAVGEHKKYISHFASDGATIHNVYPFSKGSFYGYENMGIDYKAFVVGVNGTCGTSCIIPTLEDLLLNHVDQLQAMQDHMKRVAQLLTYGMVENTWSQVDALSALLVHIRHYLLMANRQSNGNGAGAVARVD